MFCAWSTWETNNHRSTSEFWRNSNRTRKKLSVMNHLSTCFEFLLVFIFLWRGPKACLKCLLDLYLDVLSDNSTGFTHCNQKRLPIGRHGYYITPTHVIEQSRSFDRYLTILESLGQSLQPHALGHSQLNN